MSPARVPGTPRLLRALNDRAALELLLTRGPLTRAQLGELTGLSKVTASQLVERLEERGLVTRVGEQAGGRGPNAQMYAVVPQTAYVVGVDVGPQHVLAAAADITGTIVGRTDVQIADSDEPVKVVHAAVVEAAQAAGANLSRVRRVVLGTPGLVDPVTGEISFAWDLPRWHRGLLAALRADLKRPVVFENDVNLAAVAEAHSGAARGVSDFVLVWVGRGVGTAVVLGGKLHRGATGVVGISVVLDPSLVVLAGDIGQAGGTALAQRVQHEVAAIAPVSPRVVASEVPEEPVLQGALLTGLEAVREEVFGSTIDAEQR